MTLQRGSKRSLSDRFCDKRTAMELRASLREIKKLKQANKQLKSRLRKRIEKLELVPSRETRKALGQLGALVALLRD